MKKIIRYTLRVFALLLLLVVGLIAFYWQSDIPLATLKEKYAPAPSRFVEVQGMNVHFREYVGTQDTIPIVLLHGTAASLHTWEGWINALEGKHRMICLDLPAFGLTGAHPQGDYSYRSYVEFLYEFLEKMQVKNCILVGNSLGGAISWHFALAYPDRVKKMILVDAAGFPKNSERPLAFRLATVPVLNQLIKYVTPHSLVEKSIVNVYGDKSKVTDTLIDRYFELSLREGNRQAFLDRMNTKIDLSDTLKIKDLTMPTLIIWGAKDKLTPIQGAYRFAEELKNDTLVVFKDLGHVPMEEDAENTVKVVQAFLEQ
jgi:pimeloyl-ACP methyl ester carboxylesterase